MKKILALVLCALMIVGLFAGCGKEPTPTNPPATQPGGDKPAGTTAPATTADDGRSPVGELPIVTDGSRPVITVGIQALSTTEDYETNDYTVWIEENTGVDLQFVLFSSDSKESKQQINAMIAAGERLPDILWDVKSSSDTEAFKEWGRDGYVIDLMPYIDEYGYWIKQAEEKVVEIAGQKERDNIYAFGTDPLTGGYYALCNYTTQGIDATCTAMINQAFLDALGMEMPTTPDALYEYLLAVRDKDPNGNGKKDEIPLVWRDGQYRGDTTELLLNAFVYLNDNYFFNSTDGQLWVPYTTEEYREGLKFMNKLFEAELIFPATWTMEHDSEMKALTCPADGVSICGFIGGHPTLVLDGVSEAIYDYVGYGPMDGVTELGGYAFKDSNGFVYTTGITSDCEDPVLAFRVLDFMNCQESIVRQRYGVPGVHWEYDTTGWNETYNCPSAVKVLDSTAYTEQNNFCWHTCEGVIRPSNFWCGTTVKRTPEECDTPSKWRSTMISNMITKGFNEGEKPAEVVYDLVYNSEEAEVVAEVRTMVEEYVKETRALFISGAMDPNSDADWQNYLAGLKTEGCDRWLEVAQSAYDRMNGK